MAYNFLRGDRDQPFLLPPDLRDWLLPVVVGLTDPVTVLSATSVARPARVHPHDRAECLAGGCRPLPLKVFTDRSANRGSVSHDQAGTGSNPRTEPASPEAANPKRWRVLAVTQVAGGCGRATCTRPRTALARSPSS